MECDFCSSPGVVKKYPCRDFKSDSSQAAVQYNPCKALPVSGGTIVLDSHDFWAACAECAAIVETGDVDALVKHSLGAFEARDGRRHEQHDKLVAHLTLMYTQFFENRIAVVA